LQIDGDCDFEILVHFIFKYVESFNAVANLEKQASL